MIETPLAARDIPVTAPETRRSWPRKILPSLAAGVLLGLIALFEGAPLFAVGVAVVAMTSLGAAMATPKSSTATKPSNYCDRF